MVFVNRSAVLDYVFKTVLLRLLLRPQYILYFLFGLQILEPTFFFWNQVVPARVILVNRDRVVHVVFDFLEFFLIRCRQFNTSILLLVELSQFLLILWR